MAVSALPSGEDESGGIVAEINITPLTDIFLVLLIIFMVTTSVIQDESKNIDLPTATESEQQPTGVTVEVSSEGLVKINEKAVANEALFEELQLAIEGADEKIVVLRGDKLVALGEAVNILDLAQKAGAKGIAIATQQPEEG